MCRITNHSHKYFFVLMIKVLSVMLFTNSGFAQMPELPLVTDDALKNPDPADWLRWRRDSGATGFSPLSEITSENVGKLNLAWSWAMQQGDAEQEPIIYKGIMYLPHPNGVLQALDGRTGELIWEYRRRLPQGNRGGTTRNITLYQDKLYLTTTDSFLVALDARNGDLVWEKQADDDKEGVTYSAGPIAGNGMIFAGQTCWTVVGRVCSLGAFDAETGEQIWRRESIAGPGDPEEHVATWDGVPYEMRQKASFWQSGSYDPDLDIVYWTTASAYPYPEIQKGAGKGDLLYTNSILALDSRTGSIRWFFQMLPRDNFDMDHQGNPILATVNINGTVRNVVYALGKPGILWAFDREDGSYLWHRQLVEYQNLYENIDSATGSITMNESIIPVKVGDSSLVCPGMRGGRLFQTNAYSPDSNVIYSVVSNECTNFKVIPMEVSSSGLDWSDLQHMEGTNGNVGRLSAVSAETGDILWEYDQRAALGSVLATAGNLIFVGDLHRYFRALDAKNGKVLWEVPLSAPVTGYPVSYEVDGKQYVAVTVGGGSAGTRHMEKLYPELKHSNASTVLMVFSLND
jgi:alcohol dehydrogenase (cytochrome c)